MNFVNDHLFQIYQKWWENMQKETYYQTCNHGHINNVAFIKQIQVVWLNMSLKLVILKIY